MTSRLVTAVAGALLVATVCARAADVDPATDPRVRAAQAFVTRFAERMQFVVADETYDQEVRARAVVRDRRSLTSEVTLAQVRDGMWIMARHVVAVDGKVLPVNPYAQRLEDARSDAEAMNRLHQLAAEGADWNIGQFERNINSPALVLWFLTPRLAPRFRFREAGTERLRNGELAQVLRFEEAARPALMNVNGQSTPTEGRVWLSPSGAVARTELVLQQYAGTNRVLTNTGRATITVEYEPSALIDDIWLPSTMIERYEVVGNGSAETVVATARYANFRQFVVDATIR